MTNQNGDIYFREMVPCLFMRGRVKMSGIYHANIADFSHLCCAFCLQMARQTANQHRFV